MILSGTHGPDTTVNHEPGGPVTKFSIVVPAYNAEATLPETLDAVLAQESEDWECVVVDDGSYDATLAIARGYAAKDPRVRALSQPNQGTAGAYNTGVSTATGDFVVLCSADDILLPDLVSELSRFVDADRGCDIVSTNGYFLKPDGSTELVYAPDRPEERLDLANLIRGCFYGVGAAYRRGLFDLVGGYRAGVFGEDYDFWLRAMARGARRCYLPMALSMHRLSASQKSSSAEVVLRSNIRILRDLEHSVALSREERIALDDSIRGNQVRIAELEGSPTRRAARVALVHLGHPAATVRSVLRRLRSVPVR